MKKSLTFKILIVAVSAFLIFVAIVKVKYGTGKQYPNLGADLPTESFTLEKLIQLDYPPGNLAVAANGDVYFNYHPNAKADRCSPATVCKWSNGDVYFTDSSIPSYLDQLVRPRPNQTSWNTDLTRSIA